MQSHPIDSDTLNAYVDGTLPSDERALIDAQLAGNAELARELRELQATARLLNQLPEFAPRRSFRLGEEHARTAPTPLQAPGRIIQFLPIVRSLSVAAVLVFMVVGGALFFDINGDTNNTAQDTFRQQNEIMRNNGVTDSHAEASDEAEDAGNAPAAADAEDNESSMTSRGDAASVGDDPMEDLTTLQESEDGEQVAETGENPDQVAQATDSNGAPFGVAAADDDDRTSWIWTSAIVGGLALALAGLWFVMAQVGRQSNASRS